MDFDVLPPLEDPAALAFNARAINQKGTAGVMLVVCCAQVKTGTKRSREDSSGAGAGAGAADDKTKNRGAAEGKTKNRGAADGKTKDRSIVVGDSDSDSEDDDCLVLDLVLSKQVRVYCFKIAFDKRC